jgi:hypothetical protein
VIEEPAFGDSGNYPDYWLDSSLNTYIHDDVGWTPLELLLRSWRYREIRLWSSEDDAFEALHGNQSERGGGLMGGTPELTRIRAALTRVGHRALALEGKLHKIKI